VTATRVPYAEAARNLLRDTVLNAVDDLVRSRGWKATTMADVATAAGVSRQTVYNEYGSRQALVEAYVAREIQNLITEVGQAVRASSDDPHAALESAFGLFLKLASDEPVVQLVVSDSGDTSELLRLLTAAGLTLGVPQISVLITQSWPQVDPDDATLVADSLVRLAVSHALYPQDDPGTVAASVGRLISKFVDDALGLA